MTALRQERAAGRSFRIWFPPVFFAAIALGTLPIIFTLLFVPSAAEFTTVAALQGREYAAVQLPAFDRNPWLVHAHAVVGLALVLTAPFQFWRDFRNRHRQVHRIMGYVAVTCLVVLSTSGLAVAIVYPFSGVAGMIPNFVWMSAILLATGTAVTCIRRRNLVGHETWMARALAITFGITLSTIYMPFLTGVLQLPSRTALAVSFWLGVGECLFVAELWLRRPGRPGVKRPKR